MTEDHEHPGDEERRHQQEELTRKFLQLGVPNLGKQLDEMASQLRASSVISETFANSVLAITQNLTEGMSQQVEFPALRLNYETLFPDLETLREKMGASILPGLLAFQELQRAQFSDLIAKVHAAREARLPPNWRGGHIHIPDDLEALLLDEGVPLAWVPPQPVLVKIFAADSPRARRRILGASWRSITKACLSELDDVCQADLLEYVEFAAESGRALQGGKPKVSQALSANLLDTILRRSFSADSRNELTVQNNRPNIDDYPLRVAMVIGGIWASHKAFRPGDTIPRKYSRHASAHAVSRRQYSRVNSLLALMHVVSLLRVMETDLIHNAD